ncbi:MAG TPA: sigma-70 family RNA polymerase sigma factor [Acidimicrobiia bacterium]|nr:sigma-70 family RNA polymerase sigma factor [Acidimicrobiia bacterium]
MATKADAERRARFEAIWAEHSPKVRAYCIRRVASHDADDVAAEIFLVVWRRIDEIPPAPKTLLYIYGIAGKVVSNHTRSFRRKSLLDEKLRNLGVAPPVDPALLVVQSSDDADVAAAVRNLSQRDREIVMLYAWEDLPRNDIAEIMGMTRSGVDQRIHRSYQKLARALQPLIKPNPSPPVAEEGAT